MPTNCLSVFDHFVGLSNGSIAIGYLFGVLPFGEFLNFPFAKDHPQIFSPM